MPTESGLEHGDITPRGRSSAQGQVRATLSRKIGPLPVYGWGIIAGGMLVGFLYLRRKGGDSPAFTDAFGFDETGIGGGIGGFGGSGGGSSGGGTSPTTPGAQPDPENPTVPVPVMPPVTPEPTPTQPEPTEPNDGRPRGWIGPWPPFPGWNDPVNQSPSLNTPPPQQAPQSGGTGNRPPGMLSGGGANPPAVMVPSAAVTPAGPINIPQAGLTPGAWNEIVSPGGTLLGFEGFTPWAYLGNGQWQQYGPGEYSAPGETLGLLPWGMSLPGGRTARAGSETANYWSKAA